MAEKESVENLGQFLTKRVEIIPKGERENEAIPTLAQNLLLLHHPVPTSVQHLLKFMLWKP